MNIDPRFVQLTGFDQYLVDKDSGLPLAAGVVTFYEDNSRTTKKSVYRLSGSPGSYTFVELPNPLITSGSGQFVDGNTEIMVYFFPYDGTPNLSTGNYEPYYVTVYNSDGVLQFDRESIPIVEQSSVQQDNLVNYVSNFQFLAHNSVPSIGDLDAGEITSKVTEIAQGGWTFNVPESFDGTYFVTFPRFDTPVDDPSANPRYFANIKCSSPGTDTGVFLRLRWPNVSKFSAADQAYKFAFSSAIESGSTLTVTLILTRNFGTGGTPSPEIRDIITNFTIGADWDIFQHLIEFPLNTDKTLGTNNDDFVALDIQFPSSTIFDVDFTDFVLTPGDIDIINAPIQTDADMMARATFGFTNPPREDGYDLFLTPRLTKSGMVFDYSEIGRSEPLTGNDIFVDNLSTTTNLVLPYGQRYKTDEYSPLGIPWKRLYDKYWDSTANIPMYGTGPGYMSAAFYGTGNQMLFANNTGGSVTDAVDVNTGFTISTVHKIGSGSTYYVIAYLHPTVASSFILRNVNGGAVTGTSGATNISVSTLQAGVSNTGQEIPEISLVTFTGTPVAGIGYWQFHAYNAGQVNYYVWYTVDGAGSDPTPGGTGIKVAILSTDSTDIICKKTYMAVNAWQVTSIFTLAASSITGGHYFNINTTDNQFYVWYKKDGVGTDPAPVGRIGIQVDVLGADTNTQVATKTQISVNSVYFAVPNYKGLFFRNIDSGAGVDPDATSRYSLVPGITGDRLGTFQYYEFTAHRHIVGMDTIGLTLGANDVDFSSLTPTTESDTGYTGGRETRGVNITIKSAIRY